MRPRLLPLLFILLAGMFAPLVVWAMTKAQCTSQYNSCCSTCRGMPDPKMRAACWPACMAVYAGCLAAAK